uniref:C2H2-type domain-containing protein n=1 Tax=Oryzias latipes TaxID=8090 RepID=A0A3P9KA78_ORYLA
MSAAVSAQTDCGSTSAAETTPPNSGEGETVPEDSEVTGQEKRAGGRFQCPTCDKTFALKCLMNRHFLIHSRPHLCSQCGKRFAALRGLTAHSRTHTGQKLHRCAQCGTGFAHKSSFQRHMQKHAVEKARMKAGQKPTCRVCRKEFSSAVKLKYHMSVHTGEKPYACDQCDKQFSNPSNLHVHRRIHSGEKKYGCSVCGKSFIQRISLKLHTRVHTGETPFHCSTCGKDFTHRCDFRKHQRRHLAEDEGRDKLAGQRVKKGMMGNGVGVAWRHPPPPHTHTHTHNSEVNF